MSLMINGEQVEAAGKTLSDYLKEAGYDTRGIAVERNGEVMSLPGEFPVTRWNLSIALREAERY